MKLDKLFDRLFDRKAARLRQRRHIQEDIDDLKVQLEIVELRKQRDELKKQVKQSQQEH